MPAFTNWISVFMAIQHETDATTAGLVLELKAQGEETGEDKLDKRLALPSLIS